MTSAQLILVAGPHRSGTGGDPDLIARNLARSEQAAWPVFWLGHVPIIGEWAALPVLRVAAEAGVDVEAGPDVMHETASRLLEHCDAVLRLPGESSGADEDVAIARRRGIPVSFDVTEIPPEPDRAT